MNNSILIFGLNWLGDAVMSLPAIKAFKLNNQSNGLGIIAKKNILQIYKRSNLFENYIEYLPVKNKIVNIALNSKIIKSLRPQQLIVLPRSLRAALTARLSKIKIRKGFMDFPNSLLFNDGIKRNNIDSSIHRTLFYHKLLNGENSKSPEEFAFELNEETQQNILQTLNINKTTNNLIFGFVPGAEYGTAKRWEKSHFIALADYLIDKYKAHILLFGSPNEKPLCDEIKTALNKQNVISLAGEIEIFDLPDYFSICNYVITNDTGAMHVAGASGTYVFAIFGPTDYKNTPPYNNNYQVISVNEKCAPCFKRVCPIKNHPCMCNVTPQMVLDKIDERLNNG